MFALEHLFMAINEVMQLVELREYIDNERGGRLL